MLKNFKASRSSIAVQRLLLLKEVRDQKLVKNTWNLAKRALIK